MCALQPCDIVASMTTFLKTLVDVRAFEEALRGGYISERKHESDETLRVYSYTPKTQYSGRWTPETRLARGLMLRITENDFEHAVVVGRGLPKFFTIEQTESDWGRPKLVDDDEGVTVEESPELSWDSSAFVADKMNGALGLAYAGPDGLSIATKGSFGSKEAILATRLLRSKLDSIAQARFIEHFKDSTALFEIISPERPHPVDYGTTEDLFFLGAVDHATGRWTPAEENSFLAKELNFGIAQRLALRTLREAVEMPHRLNTEGLVVTLDDERGQHLYKVKTSEYLELRRAFYATETVDMAAIMLSLSSEELEALTPATIPLPVGLRNQEAARAKITVEVLEPLALGLGEARSLYAQVRSEGTLPARGDFARVVLTVTDKPQLLFNAYDEELNGNKTLATQILKNILKELKSSNS